MNVTAKGYITTENNYPTNDLVDLRERLPDTVEGITWDEAVSDMAFQLRNVHVDDLKMLVNKLEAGQIDGRSDQCYVGKCGCFIATLGWIAGTKNNSHDGFHAWSAFEYFYNDVSMLTPFQRWLFLIRPGNTPKNNKLACEFANALRALINTRV